MINKAVENINKLKTRSKGEKFKNLSSQTNVNYSETTSFKQC